MGMIGIQEGKKKGKNPVSPNEKIEKLKKKKERKKLVMID